MRAFNRRFNILWKVHQSIDLERFSNRSEHEQQTSRFAAIEALLGIIPQEAHFACPDIVDPSIASCNSDIVSTVDIRR